MDLDMRDNCRGYIPRRSHSCAQFKGGKTHRIAEKAFSCKIFSSLDCLSVIACVIVGLVGGTSYYNRYKAEELARKEYGENDKTLTTPITSPSTILGQAYNQCYPPTGVTESGSYDIDSYEASITGEAGTLTGGATSAELLQTTIELGCVLNALNIQSPQFGTSALNYLLTNAASKATSVSDGILSGQKNLIEGPYEVSVITLLTTNVSAPLPLSGIIFSIYPHPMTIDGYKWNTEVLPNINTINTNSTFDSSASTAIPVLSQLASELDDVIINSSEDGKYNFSSLSTNSLDTNKSSNTNNSGSLNNQSTSPTNTPNDFNNSSSISSSANSADQTNPTSPSPSSSNATNSNTNGNLNSTTSNKTSGNNNSNTSSQSNSEAITAMTNAEECSSIYSFYNYMDVESQQVTSGNGATSLDVYFAPYILIKGGGKWGKVWACVAQKLQMPSTVETKLKSYLNSSDPHYQKLSTSWEFDDGSNIYLNYEGPLVDNTVGWITRLSVIKNSSANDN